MYVLTKTNRLKWLYVIVLATLELYFHIWDHCLVSRERERLCFNLFPPFFIGNGWIASSMALLCLPLHRKCCYSILLECCNTLIPDALPDETAELRVEFFFYFLLPA